MIKRINDPAVPYIGCIDRGNFCPGNIIKIQGWTPNTACRFNINLQCGPETTLPSDVALQVAVHMSDEYISLNSLQNTQWSEQLGILPIKRNTKFEVILTCDFNHYKVRINGRHYSGIHQRTHYSCITHLAINGDVSIFQISYESTTENQIEEPARRELSEGLQPSALVFSTQNDGDELETAATAPSAPNPEVYPPPFSEPSAPPTYEAAINASARPPYPTCETTCPTSALGSKDFLPYPSADEPRMLPQPSRKIGLVLPPSNIIGIYPSPSNTPIPLNAGSSNAQPEGRRRFQGGNHEGVRYILGGILLLIAVVVFIMKVSNSLKKDEVTYSE